MHNDIVQSIFVLHFFITFQNDVIEGITSSDGRNVLACYYVQHTMFVVYVYYAHIHSKHRILMFSLRLLRHSSFLHCEVGSIFYNKTASTK